MLTKEQRAHLACSWYAVTFSIHTAPAWPCNAALDKGESHQQYFQLISIAKTGSDLADPLSTMCDGAISCKHTDKHHTLPVHDQEKLHAMLPACAGQDVESLVHMARRRCMDDKAAVRKAGLQLLEALLMMRAKGLGGADPELPSEQDIRALEAATADALVSCNRFMTKHSCPCTQS